MKWVLALLVVLSGACGSKVDLDATDPPGSEEGDQAEKTPEKDLESDGQGTPTELELVEGVTYHEHIRPVIESRCLSCHVDQGVAPFRLDRFEDVDKYRELVVLAVENRVMPPWPAADDCRDLRDAQGLADDQRVLFPSWKANDFAEGDPDDYQAPEIAETRDPGEPDIVMTSGKTYQADVGLTDDYRCFVMEGGFEQDTFIRGMNILPGVESLVHHVQIHVIAGDQLGAAEARDLEDEAHGYTCFGGVGVPGAANIFSWRPGSAAVLFDEGEAGLIRAGSRVVIQVHYNTQWIEPGEEAEPDETKIAFWTMPEGELPESIIQRRMLLHFLLDIPAGEPEAVMKGSMSGMQIANVGGQYVPGEVIGMTPHMHNLGTRLKVDLLSGGGDPACLIDVPRWDFEWQFDYMYPRGEAVPLAADDTLELTCVYDNSVQNQPILQGERLQPRQVGWGDGSLDEMCLSYVWVRYDRAAYLEVLGQ